MYIHNLYNDIMLSISLLLDKTIFQKDIIKKYEYNLGNRTFQLNKDYKANIDLPTAIVTINDDQVIFGHRTETIKQLVTENINAIPVLYNNTNKLILYLKEEQVNLPITVNINVESQLQAKELYHIIKQYLPLNKLIQQLSFCSFLEVESKFLLNNLFDPYNDNIINIFSKFNKLLGHTDYYYSVRYEPHIRLDSLSTTIPDSSQRTYQVILELTYSMQWPMYLFCNKNNLIEKININIGPNELNPITSFNTIQLFKNDNKNKIIKNHLIYDNTNIINYDNNNIYLDIEFELQFIELSKHNISFNLISLAKDKYIYDITPYNYLYDENKVIFKINKDQFEEFKPSYKNPIILQLVI